MSFTDGKPFIATEKMLNMNWGGKGPSGFSCHMCLRRFVLNDIVRFVYCPGAPNILVCKGCDGNGFHGEPVEKLWETRWTTVILPILKMWCSDYGKG